MSQGDELLSPQRGGANTSEGDGTLTTADPSDEPTADRYVYDPWDPVPTGASTGYFANAIRSADNRAEA